MKPEAIVLNILFYTLVLIGVWILKSSSSFLQNILIYFGIKFS